MLVHSRLQQQSNPRPLSGGILVVGFLCLLAAWSLDSTTEYSGSDTERNGHAISVDMPLHANSEHSFTLKRFFTRHKDQPKSAEPVEPIWALSSGEFILVPSLAAVNQNNPIAHSPYFSLHNLQTLNISRAPPLV
ncbi:MAG TPA: hypothetical protein VGE32_00415 [Cellvibrio sp.]